MISSFSSRQTRLPFAISLFTLALSAAAVADTTVKLPQPVPATVGATLVGRLPSSTTISGSMSLAPSNRAAFQAYADAVSNPSSASYHRFLTPAQIGTRFGASTGTFNAAVSFLKGKGLTVTLAADSHLGILFQGRADKVESAFSTKLYAYTVTDRSTRRGTRSAFAYGTALSVPKTIASSVVSVNGLQTIVRPRPMSTLTPDQARTLYSTSTRYNASPTKGSGINVGITNFDGYRLSNLPPFYAAFGLPTPAGGIGSNIRRVAIDAGNGETAGADGEADLDIQMVLSNAPFAQVYIYDATQSGDLAGLLTRMSQDNIVDVVTESYGHAVTTASDAYIIAAHDQHTALSVQGVTYCCASGDTGTDLTAGSDFYFGYPDFDPEVTTVGGTSATVSGTGARLAEDGWAGSGSGWSTFAYSFNTRPVWQTGGTIPSAPNFRLFPDVARHASGSVLPFSQYGGGTNDFAYYIFLSNGATSSETVSSGTSASSPNFAGSLALVLERLKSDGAADLTASGRYRLGRINDFIYTLQGNNSVFYDVLTGDTGALPDGREAVGGPGWDFVTGLGAPDTEGLYNAFLSIQSLAVNDSASSANLLTLTSPSLTLGTVVTGSATSLPTTDNVSYIIRSVKQNGVGQVAATTVAVPLQTSKSRRSATVNLSMQLPSKATGYLYLLNKTTNAYDLVKTVPGTGSMGITNVLLDVSDDGPYIVGSNGGKGGTVTAIVRALQPTRLGSSSFDLTIDQCSVVERVSRN